MDHPALGGAGKIAFTITLGGCFISSAFVSDGHRSTGNKGSVGIAYITTEGRSRLLGRND